MRSLYLRLHRHLFGTLTLLLFANGIWFSALGITITGVSIERVESFASKPTLTGLMLSSATVVYGSIAPTITPPTSASSGAITYTSSNTSVATVSGSTITLVGVGTATLTATQAASGNFSSATATTNLTVTGQTPTLSGFGIPSSIEYLFGDFLTIPANSFRAKVLPYDNADNDIVLTPPSSNSQGAFTYSSSNATVIIDDWFGQPWLRFTSLGTFVITATQEAQGNFSQASISFSVHVYDAGMCKNGGQFYFDSSLGFCQCINGFTGNNCEGPPN